MPEILQKSSYHLDKQRQRLFKLRPLPAMHLELLADLPGEPMPLVMAQAAPSHSLIAVPST